MAAQPFLRPCRRLLVASGHTLVITGGGEAAGINRTLPEKHSFSAHRPASRKRFLSVGNVVAHLRELTKASSGEGLTVEMLSVAESETRRIVLFAGISAIATNVFSHIDPGFQSCVGYHHSGFNA